MNEDINFWTTNYLEHHKNIESIELGVLMI